ncbi:MAG: SPOR domain-containing protein [Flavobacteriales bacterium]|nr:SPOR domain-containing protein [Flavobacteriales bacterium]
MLKRISFLLIAFLCITSVFAQEENDSIVEPKEEAPKEMFYGPTVGLGVGMFKFYGDILDENYGNPLISNIGYDLHVSQQLNSFLTAKFYVLFGTLSANERSAQRNLNFRSSITVGGFALIYNFDQLLPEKRIISPFISLGIESVEFHSKTDLFDEFGNEYNYWSDGSIRDIPETDPNAANAVIIQRDYFYETDLRELNADGYGKYKERTFAIPIGIGVKMHMTKNIDFTVGTSFHFTFSDVIDNITDESGGERIGTQPGNGGNDKFLMSSFSISYNFLKHDKEEKIKEFEEDIDYLAYDMDDEDGDGVIDFIDECPWTPEGVEVDDKGCPLDNDGDFVPNYKDDELETREKAPVTPNGVEMTDTMIYIAYQRYLDSTGMFAETETRIIAAEKRKKKKIYRVQVGEFTEAIDADLVDKFLSIPDVEIKTFGDSLTIIAVGDYNNLPEAIKRKMQLTSEGFDAAIVVEEEKDGTFTSVGDAANNMNVDNVAGDPINSQGLIFRVQLGAFSKRLSKDYLNGLNNIMEIKADDGLWKYLYTGSFKTMEDAARMKIDLAIDYGVEEAFIVAYKNGKRIPLVKAGVESSAVENITPTENKEYDKAAIKFKVQIGSYSGQLPTEVLSKFMELDGVEQTELDGGLTRYTAGGEFSTYEEAEAFKAKVAEEGMGGAFIIALHKGELIPVNKAKEVLAE